MVPTLEEIALDPAALVAELGSLPASVKNGHQCYTAAILSGLPDDVRPVIQSLMDRADISAPDVCAVLGRHGLSLRSASLVRHRKRGTPAGCRCPRDLCVS